MNNKWELINGIDFYYIKLLAQYFNFSYSLIYSNQEFGNKLPNGEWNGVIGKIARNVNIIFFLIILYKRIIKY